LKFFCRKILMNAGNSETVNPPCVQASDIQVV
jgi:hypothetical protein